MPKKQVVYIKPNGRQTTTNKWFPELSIMKSTIARAGNGVFAKEDIVPKQEISKYGGKMIAECEADKKRDKAFLLSRNQFECI